MSGVNISATGMFVETAENLFQLGEQLKLTCRAEGYLSPFNVVATVVRFSKDERTSVGYGLRFENLEPKVASEIQRLVDSANQKLKQA